MLTSSELRFLGHQLNHKTGQFLDCMSRKVGRARGLFCGRDLPLMASCRAAANRRWHTVRVGREAGVHTLPVQCRTSYASCIYAWTGTHALGVPDYISSAEQRYEAADAQDAVDRFVTSDRSAYEVLGLSQGSFSPTPAHIGELFLDSSYSSFAYTRCTEVSALYSYRYNSTGIGR